MYQKIEKQKIIIFTDLDGTLLDHQNYSFEAAQKALKKIKAFQIPLIICTSKTRAEIEVWRKRLNNNDAFISENGGAIFFPKLGIIPNLPDAIDRNGYKIIELGMHYKELLVRFRRLKDIFGKKMRGFSEMDVDEIADLTGLSRDEAELAKRREYTEPFLFTGNENEIETLEKNINQMKLKLTRGGRFFHLLGDNDKGKAVIIVSEIYKKKLPELKTIALGDSYNDLPMLQKVDIPILVQKIGGNFDERIKNVPNLIRASGIGPEGWNKALLEIIEMIG
jgi:mannosyl-3-phosphoglycerate phosphatase